MAGARPPARSKHDIYSTPLPLQTYPLPDLIPHNPITILRIAYALFFEYIYPHSIHPSTPRSFLKSQKSPDKYKAYLDPYTLTIQVTDPVATRMIWERGFFGKGSLSRSEPEWIKRVEEARRKREEAQSGKGRKAKTAAEVTDVRRRERKEAKRERARKEVEVLEDVLRRERNGEEVDISVLLEGKVEGADTDVMGTGNEEAGVTNEDTGTTATAAANDREEAEGTKVGGIEKSTEAVVEMADRRKLDPPSTHIPSEPIPIPNEEHLQLAPQEAFFLAYGLGIISVVGDTTHQAMSTPSLLKSLCASSTFPPKASIDPCKDPANDFLVSYAVYHHFRSLGWVVRPGIKFSVDYLLYARGPVFAHAQFAVMILPSFSHPYWVETEERRQRKKKAENKDWWHFHCINRVQSQVLKTLVLCYVDIPPPLEDAATGEDLDIGALLRRYKVREFAMRRWAPQRNLK